MSPALARQLTQAKEGTRENEELGSEAVDVKPRCQTGAPSPEASNKPASAPTAAAPAGLTGSPRG